MPSALAANYEFLAAPISTGFIVSTACQEKSAPANMV
jgi:hypothetical protein